MDTIKVDQMRAEHSKLLDESLRMILQRLSAMPDVEKVILFGSFAEGCRDLFTDLDLIVVMRTEQAFIDRSAHLYGLLQPAVDVDILVYTPEEIERMSQQGFVRQALQTGQVLYEK